MKLLRKLLDWPVRLIIVMFILPALASLAVWEVSAGYPDAWHKADWSSAGILHAPKEDAGAEIYLFAAKTGRWKGAFSVHSWLVVKAKGAQRYDRYEVVGWGKPLVKNGYAPDARWYSNEPEIVYKIEGDEAERLLPKIMQAIATYPHGDFGDYVIWPGPNSNTFVAHVLNAVPEAGLALPGNAVGRDYLGPGRFYHLDDDANNLQLSLFGYAGIALGVRHGLEFNFLGLVFGVDFKKPALKVPGFGTLSL